MASNYKTIFYIQNVTCIQTSTCMFELRYENEKKNQKHEDVHIYKIHTCYKKYLE
jgi:hypothetical protein